VRELLGRDTLVGYCTNVHAGAGFREMRRNLEHHATAVKAAVSPDAPLPVGLWLARPAAAELCDPRDRETFAGWLRQRGLMPYTFNGFPYSDFHASVVKHRVYEPDWTSGERAAYTIELAEILAALLGEEEEEGSISTLPLGWRAAIEARPDAVERATENLLRVAEHLVRLEERSGKRIHVDLEPEPGCYLDTARDVVDFFRSYLFPRADERVVRRHLGVCHDVCHAAVMFEEQAAVLRAYREAAVPVGKVQLSAAVRAPLQRLDERRRRAALEQLSRFEERRYLHQTVVRSGEERKFFDDLQVALAAADLSAAEWRVHFHVPLFVDRFGLLESTNDEVLRWLEALRDEDGVRHFEVETYAWDVLPGSLRTGDLAAGIARELTWLRERAAGRPTG
jgi:sugar phosphate isomerase/epimerase